MGNYATSTNLQDRFQDADEVVQLTDNVDAGTVDTVVLDEVIDHAEGQVNSYVGVKYIVPVVVSGDAGLTAMMKSVTLDIAQFHLVARGDQVTEPKQLAHDKAIEWLVAVAKGEVVLPTAATPATTTSRNPLVNWGTAGTSSTSKRVFSRSNTSGV